MDFLDLTLGTVAENVALDESLLLRAEAGQGGEVLRIWDYPSHAVVLGSGCKLTDDVDVAACALDGVPIVRRSSGGGTVLLGRGCLCYSLVLAYSRCAALGEIRPSYAWIMQTVIEALGIEGVTQEGISDLAIGGRKFSGNAQQRKRNHLLHHGTLLHGMDLAGVGRYLRLPARQPDYREGRGHEEFIRNVPVERGRVVAGLREVWQAWGERQDSFDDEVGRLVREKYATDEWAARR